MFVRIVGFDRTVLAYKIVNKIVGKGQVLFLFCNMVEFQNGLNHAAVHVIPGRFLAFFDFFDIPDRHLGAAFFQQLFNVAVKNFHDVTPLIVSFSLNHSEFKRLQAIIILT